jgi:EAL domain-containing protein (putative c-di-GMP-specific phosphodiesterase class I)
VALLGIGRSSVDLPALSRRSAFYEVVPAAGGRVVLAEALAEAKPPGTGAWEPIEFLAVVNAAGLSAPLVPTVRSKLEEVDAYFASYLTQHVRIGAKLAPGVYRIWVGP